jgi:hypothetical protein
LGSGFRDQITSISEDKLFSQITVAYLFYKHHNTILKPEFLRIDGTKSVKMYPQIELMVFIRFQLNYAHLFPNMGEPEFQNLLSEIEKRDLK